MSVVVGIFCFVLLVFAVLSFAGAANEFVGWVNAHWPTEAGPRTVAGMSAGLFFTILAGVVYWITRGWF